MTKTEEIKELVEKALQKYGQDSRPIYALMLFENPEKELVNERTGKKMGFPDLGGVFEPGFYYDLDDAVNAMHENACDIRETVYNAGFVLVRFPGMYSSSGFPSRIYFVWDEEQKGFFEADEPELFRHVAY